MCIVSVVEGLELAVRVSSCLAGGSGYIVYISLILWKLTSISRWAIIIFALTISLSQLGIAPLLVTATFNIILGGIVLALALAFGLGFKDLSL
jgi:hypothetical protein